MTIYNPSTVAELIKAIDDANNSTEADTINLAAGSTYTLTDVNNTTDNTGSGGTKGQGLPIILSTGGALTINGNGATIERGPNAPDFRFFYVDLLGNLTLNNLTLTNGASDGVGGAILSDSDANITINNSTISGNKSTGDGGAIYALASYIIFTNSTITNNTTGGNGGGIAVIATPITLKNTLVANNTDTSITTNNPDLFADIANNGRFVDDYGNLVGDSTGATFQDTTGKTVNPGDISPLIGTATNPIDPKLGPLADNGGGAKTHALLSGSKAIDAGLDANATALTTDQRGTGYPRKFGTTVDIGAFEAWPEIDVLGNNITIASGDTTPITTDNTDFGSASVGTGNVTKTFTIKNLGAPDLTLSGTPKVTITGANASDFTVGTDATTPITANNSTTYDIKFVPSAAGIRTATISIANNDSNENPYTFTIQGTGSTAPEIDVQGNSVSIPDGNTTASTTNDTDFGQATVGNTTVSKTFTILNTGTGNLTLSGTPKVAITGANASDFTITTDPTTPVNPNGTANFIVKFNPTATGTRTATVNIANDDSNENPYDFTIQGTGQAAPAPEIQVLDGTTDIVDGTTTAINVGNTTVGTPVNKTFTIKNLGNSTLNLSALSLPTGFTVVGNLPTTIAGGQQADLVVKLDGTTVGDFTGKLQFTNNDSDENPFDFPLVGKVTAAPAPEIQVLDGTTDIVDGTTTAINVGNTTVGTPVNKTFTIKNLGNSTLNLSALSLPTGFTIVGNLPTTIAGGQQADLVVKLDGTTVGDFTGKLQFTNNDSDENPFDFPLVGKVTAAPAPEIQVLDGTTDIVDGTTTAVNVGNTTVGTSVNKTFTVKNLGNSTLNLSALSLPTGFTVVGNLPTTIAANQQADLVVKLDGKSVGDFTGKLQFTNDDSDENPFDFPLVGKVTAAPAPEIQVLDGTTDIVDGTTTAINVGNTTVGTSVNKTLTVKNLGSSTLNLSALSLPTGFTVVGNLPTTIAGGQQADLVVKLDGTTVGDFTGKLQFTNNDSDENPFDFPLVGKVTAAPAPEIQVLDGTTDIVDGTTTAINVGNTTVGTPVNKTFTVKNLGSSTLNLSALSLPTGFTVVGNLPTTIAGGQQADLVVKLDGTTVGDFTGKLQFTNNDSDENPFDFPLVGKVTAAPTPPPVPAPEINIKGNNTDIVTGDTTPATTDNTDFGSTDLGTGVSKTYTIENLGTANLTLSGTPKVTITGANAGDFSITTDPTTPVNANGTANFVVNFNPTVTGVRTATVSIANNDSDENPYTFNIQGTGATKMTPEIDVKGNGISIADRATLPATNNNTDFGTATVNGTEVTKNFTIANTGTASLNLTGTQKVTVSGPNAKDFSITTDATTPVNANGTANFTVAFKPQGPGTRTAAISIPNDDSNENPYLFIIQGTGESTVTTAPTPAPAPTIPVVTSTTTPSDTVRPSVVSVTVPSSQNYGAGANLDFTVKLSENVTVTDGSTPSISLLIGDKLVSADYVSGSGGSDLVFRYTVKETDRDIDGINVISQANFDGTIKDAAGNSAIGTLNNLGNTSGIIVDNVKPTVTSVTVPDSSVYKAGSDLSFTVKLSENVKVNGTPTLPLTIGDKQVNATYVSGSGTRDLLFQYKVQETDTDNDGITIGNTTNFEGTITDEAGNQAVGTLNNVGNTSGVLVGNVAFAPRIEVSVANANDRTTPIPGTIISNGTTTLSPIGTTVAGRIVSKTFVISNKGTDPLKLTDLKLTGQFGLLGGLPEEIPPGESGLLTVRFGGSLQSDTGTLEFKTNDPSNNTFTFPILGSVQEARELSLGGNGVDQIGNDLSGLRFWNVSSKNSNFSGADLRDASLPNANLTGGIFRNTNLGGTSLYKADLTGADFTGSNMRSARLEKADLTGANLTNVDFTGAKTTAANFKDATLTGAKGLQRTVLQNGPVTRATVFLDANSNGVKDPNEPSTTTNDQGSFILDPISAGSKIVAFGGTDTSTNKKVNVPLSAPSNSLIISPTTTVVYAKQTAPRQQTVPKQRFNENGIILDQNGMPALSLEELKLLGITNPSSLGIIYRDSVPQPPPSDPDPYLKGLGISSGTDLLTYNPLADMIYGRDLGLGNDTGTDINFIGGSGDDLVTSSDIILGGGNDTVTDTNAGTATPRTRPLQSGNNPPTNNGGVTSDPMPGAAPLPMPGVTGILAQVPAPVATLPVPVLINNLTPKQIQALTPDQIKALNPDVIKVWTPKQIQALTPDQIKALNPDVIKVWTPKQIKALTPGQIKALTYDQIDAFSSDQIKDWVIGLKNSAIQLQTKNTELLKTNSKLTSQLKSTKRALLIAKRKKKSRSLANEADNTNNLTPEDALLSDQITNVLAESVIKTGQEVDLGDPAFIKNVLTDTIKVVAQSDPDFDPNALSPETITAIAQAIATGNQLIEAAANTGATAKEAALNITKATAVTMGEVADSIEQFAAGDLTLADFQAKTTLAAMSTSLDQVSVNDPTADFPPIETDDFVGTPGNDNFNGLVGDDFIDGLAGNDTLYGGKDRDQIDGKEGNDLLSGNNGDDLLLGGLNDDILYGGKDNDILSGDEGNDSLFGDLGDDQLTGDAGADNFVLGLNQGTDQILDFTPGEDKIILAGLKFEDLTISQQTTDGISDTVIQTKNPVQTLAILPGFNQTLSSANFGVL